jgi:hypothetical protein
VKHLHFSRRMCEQYPYGAEYGCAITRYVRKHRAADIALYIVAALAVLVIWWTA